MAWIKTVPPEEAGDELRRAFQDQAALYPPEYAVKVDAVKAGEATGDGTSIVGVHSLLPRTLFHTFSTYGSLLSPDLPLSRMQHEMIAATVSALNDCFY